MNQDNVYRVVFPPERAEEGAAIARKLAGRKLLVKEEYNGAPPERADLPPQDQDPRYSVTLYVTIPLDVGIDFLNLLGDGDL